MLITIKEVFHVICFEALTKKKKYIMRWKHAVPPFTVPDFCLRHSTVRYDAAVSNFENSGQSLENPVMVTAKHQVLISRYQGHDGPRFKRQYLIHFNLI